MDTTYGLLCYLHCSFDENVAVIIKILNRKKILITFNFLSVSLTYRVKSAHKVKLTDKQLLQWMVPILLVYIIYLGTWTVSSAPVAEEVK